MTTLNIGDSRTHPPAIRVKRNIKIHRKHGLLLVAPLISISLSEFMALLEAAA
jgi:hypothetical protein